MRTPYIPIALALSALCGCAHDGDEVDPYEPSEAEGVEEASDALTDLSGQCAFSGPSGLMEIDLDGGDIALIVRSASGVLLVNGFPCHGASATTLIRLVVRDRSAGDQTFILDYSGGLFGAGRSGSAGVDVDLGSQTATDAFKIIGSEGVDSLVFGSAGAAINPDAFTDIVVAGAEQIVVSLGAGNDVFSGAGSAATGDPFPGRLEIYGSAGNDTIRGGAGNDLYSGGEGSDVLQGGPGDDGSDALGGGNGNDTADYSARSAALSLSIDGLANDGAGGAAEGDDIKADIEVLRGGTGNDILVGGAGSQTLYGGPGGDTLRGGAGGDILWGDAGDDRLDEGTSSSGADFLGGGTGIDTADYSARSVAVSVTLDAVADDGQVGEGDTVAADVENLSGGGGDDRLTGSAAANLLVGGGGDDTLNGGDGADLLRGGAGSDTLDGGPGNDVLDAEAGPAGDDLLRGGAGVDRADYSARSAPVDVTMDGATASGEAGEGDRVATDVENLRGGPDDDRLTGNTLDNLIEGGDGVDMLDGRSGDDVVDGEAGADIVDCGDGDGDILLDSTTASIVGCEL